MQLICTIKQGYILVLGLDVLGNPFGVIRGLAEGVESLFYEPYAGAVQGPGEFAEGVALGIGKLVGNTVGGAAGAIGKITGTLGKGRVAWQMGKLERFCYLETKFWAINAVIRFVKLYVRRLDIGT